VIILHAVIFALTWWLGDIILGCWTYNQEVVCLNLSQVTIKWLLVGWVTVYRPVDHPGISSRSSQPCISPE